MSLIKWIALGALAALVLLFVFLPVVAWILVGLVALILAVVLLVPVGADVAYIAGEFRLAARVDGFAVQLIPRKPPDPAKKPREKKPRKEKEKKEASGEPQQEAKPRRRLHFSFTKEELFELVKKALNGLGKFGKITVRSFMLHYAAAGEDPCNTAMTFNYVNAALSSLAPVCARKFRVTGSVDVRTEVDFTTDKTRIDAEASLTIRLIQVVHAALAVAVGALGVLIKNRLRLRREARLAGKNGAAPDERETTDSMDIEIQAEERNDLHG